MESLQRLKQRTVFCSLSLSSPYYPFMASKRAVSTQCSKIRKNFFFKFFFIWNIAKKEFFNLHCFSITFHCVLATPLHAQSFKIPVYILIFSKSQWLYFILRKAIIFPEIFLFSIGHLNVHHFSKKKIFIWRYLVRVHISH